MKKSRLQQNKRIMIILTVFIIGFGLLAGKTAWLQIVQGEKLSREALQQQTSDNTVSAKRGKIYDRNYKVLASNTTVETISIAPAELRGSIEKNQLTAAKVAEELGNRLSMDAENIETIINKQSSFEYLKKKVEKETADSVREYIEEKNLKGINFVEDVKRFYPYNNLASHVIGFVGSDNQGLEGIESIYDEELSGIPGRVVTTQQTTGLDSGTSYENYIEAQDGCSVVLTIDEVIQGYVEKHLENARIASQLEAGAAAIVMDVNTGDILAMSSKPDYDLNAPFEITDAIREKYDGIDEELKQLEGTEYTERLNEVIQTVRRNKAVVDSYEPGSTFKAMVASLGLETGAVKLEDTFTCTGVQQVLTESIHCANRNGHGTQTFAEAVRNSCNPAFIQIGQKIGKERFLEGLRAFGFFEETGIELPGETAGVGFTLNNFTDVDLATSSFGQSVTVTPLQMITAVSAVANGGKLYKPHLVKEIINSDNIVVEKNEPELVRQVISEETSNTMCGILESVVSEGGGKNAYLAGYRIAGKTGTSEKLPRGNGHYIASFLAFAPADDPQVACLVILDQPPVGMPYYGGTIAAPVVKNIMEETLQYLGVEPRYNENEKEYVDIEVPDLSGKSVEEATQVLKEAGFEIRVKGEGGTVTDQIPKAHTRLSSGSTVVAYMDGTKAERSIEVPDVIGESAANASAMLVSEGLNARIRGIPGEGSAVCASQSPEARTIVEPGTVVTIDFQYQGAND
ncbi:penicillin-binding transpeptidase domain-containing protein [Ructibacterium gallinarum]|uniref:PASTA domain-containing protein n=1 Tax=Ructibacterium gallinarum TaxID=2779355 RepID=A0A9D5R8H2_9FIRM|nr:penicillin-binding transpeptidase domain-containing protein [Ructibacterium gallinarum]MBE5039957.1 PASTA domain-containing protein [Ructibacterium gallinarum]